MLDELIIALKWLRKHKDALAAAQSLMTMLAILVGAFWSYRAFVRGRLRYPRIDLTHVISHRYLSDGRILLHVNVAMKNQGSILARIGESHTAVQLVLPLLDDNDLADCGLEKSELYAISAGAIEGTVIERMRKDETDIAWTQLARIDKSWDQGYCEIEPGELENFGFDFVLRSGVRTVRVYSFFRNNRKRRGLGWRAITFYDTAPTDHETRHTQLAAAKR